MRLRLCVGDIAVWRGVDAVAVSTNRSLQGNANPQYWRFAGRESADGAVRRVAGEELAMVAAELHGTCSVGEAVATPAFGALVTHGCRHVVHVVVPDGLQVHAGGSDRHVQQTGLLLLQQSFSAAIMAAAGCGARSLALPALGCGVNGWSPLLAAAAATHAIVDAAKARAVDTNIDTTCISAVDVVLQTNAMALRWLSAVEAILGPCNDEVRWQHQHPQPSTTVVGTWTLESVSTISLPSLSLAVVNGNQTTSNAPTATTVAKSKGRRRLLAQRTLERVLAQRTLEPREEMTVVGSES